MIESAEGSMIVSARQGFSCAGYRTLNNRTFHLRESPYVTVAADGRYFRPSGRREHFPVSEINAYYLDHTNTGLHGSIGAGGSEIVFSGQGPDADEGATIIAGCMTELEGVLAGGLPSRLAFAWAEQWQYVGELLAGRKMMTPAYRPPEVRQEASWFERDASKPEWSTLQQPYESPWKESWWR